MPPSEKAGPDKACDIGTHYVDDNYAWHMFCFSEGKRARNTSQSKIRTLENQAQGYCEEYINSHPEVNLVYANTLVGASIRCWKYQRGDSKLRGFWDGDTKDHFEHYKDVGEEVHRPQLENTFADMKSMPPGVLRMGQLHSEIRLSDSQHRTPATFPLGSNAPTGSSNYNPYNQASDSMYTTPMPLAVPQQPTRIEPTSTLRVDILSPDLLLPLRDEDYVEVTLVRRGQDINSNVY